MRFADPQACPDCRGVIQGQSACPHCGLDLTSVEVRQLWQVLLQADDLLERASRHPRRPPPHAAPPHAAPSQPVPEPPMPPAAAPATAAPATAEPSGTEPAGTEPFVAVPPGWRYPVQPPPAAAPPAAAVPPAGPGAVPSGPSWSVGTILLVLGAFGLVVAGLIFVTRSWDDIGLAGRTLILLAVTVVIGGLGTWVTRRPLRASAEAVWSVFLALLTLDVAAAHHEDLAGLGTLDAAYAWIVWGAVSLALSTAIALWARRHVEVELVAPAVAGALAIAAAGVGATAAGDGWDTAWRPLAGLVVAGLLALATRPAGLPRLTAAVRVVVGIFYAVAYVVAVAELVGSSSLDELVRGGHGGPLLVMGIASAVIARVVAPVRAPATALAVVAAIGLVTAPVIDTGRQDVLWSVVAVLAVLTAAAGMRGDGPWMQGVRLGAVSVVGGLAVVQLVLVGELLATVGRVLDEPWRLGWDTRLDAAGVGDHAAWVVPVVLLGLVATTWSVTRWPELSTVRPRASAVVAWAASIGAVTSVVALRWPVWAMASSLLLVAVAVAVLRLRRSAPLPTGAAFVLVAAASLLGAASHGVSSAAWLVGGAVLLGIAQVGDAPATRHVHAGAGTVLVLGGAAALVDLVGADDGITAVAVVVVALALTAVAHLSPPASLRALTPSVEAVSGLGLLAALLWPADSAEVSVRWTVAGVGLMCLAAAVRTRRWLVWPGVGCLVVAYVALILDSGFSFVEAYTLPLGAAALAAGLVVVIRKPATSTWALLGPGLAVALLPSVPQALADPTGLRALLLGAGALVALAAGVVRAWQAPFVAGVVVLTLLVLFNIGPYANAAPRVVLIAVVSAVLLGVGITWEDRVRDGRRLVAYLRSMR